MKNILKNILKSSVRGKNRYRFSNNFDHLISQKLQENGVNCYLKQSFNWFSKKNNYAWYGQYLCIDKSCKLQFKANISESNIDGSVSVYVKWNGNCLHEKKKRRVRCTGKERKEMAKTIRANGNDLVKQDHLLFNELNEGKICVL